MQAVVLGLIGPHASGEVEFSDYLIRLQTRIGRHLQRRRQLLLAEAFELWGKHFHDEQPLLPDPKTFDWEGSMYAVPQLSGHCRASAAERSLSPTVGFYLDSGIGGVPLDGFCRNPNLEKHGLLVNHDGGGTQSFPAARLALRASELRDDSAAEKAEFNGSVGGSALASGTAMGGNQAPRSLLRSVRGSGLYRSRPRSFKGSRDTPATDVPSSISSSGSSASS